MRALPESFIPSFRPPSPLSPADRTSVCACAIDADWAHEWAERLQPLGIDVAVQKAPVHGAIDPSALSSARAIVLELTEASADQQLQVLRSLRDRTALPVMLVLSHDDGASVGIYRDAGFATLGKAASTGEIRAVLELALYRHEIERHQARERQTQDLLRLKSAALRISANSIVITDGEGRIEWANDSFSKVTGYAASEFLGRKIGELLRSGKHSSAFFREFWTTLTSGRVWSGEITNRRKDGSLFVEESTVTPIRDDEGRITHFIAVKQDVSERKLLEAKMRQAQKMEAVGQLAGGVAHDFNNILAAVLMYLGLLQDDEALDVKTRLALKDLEREVQRGATLTRQLLTFSRQQAMEPRPLDLHEILAGLLKMLRRLLGEHITLNLGGRTSLPLIEADPGMIEQIVINLCVNARDAMPRGGLITLTTDVVEDLSPSSKFPDAIPGPCVHLAVTDQGCGMDEATLEHMFEPFFTTKEVGRGTGLGLATVYGILRQHRGWADVESEPGRGTTFHLYFPVASSPSVTPVARPAPIRPPRGRGETVLVVEDEPSVRSIVALSLQRNGYHVVEAENGPDALQSWQKHSGRFDLLISDMVMPGGLSGLEVALQLRTHAPGLKVLLCTGYSPSAGAEPLDPGLRFTLLRKPFDPSRLLTAVRQCLDQA